MNETPASPAPAAKLVAAEDLAAATMATAPEPTGTKPPTAPGAAAEVEKDSIGRPFDAAKFKREKDSMGRWKNLYAGRGGKKPADTAAAAPSAGETPTAELSVVAPDDPAPDAPKGPDKFDLAADMYCRAFYSAADSIFSGKGEWAPDDDAEHVELRNAAAAYMRVKGMEDLPPGPALLLAVGTYVAKRTQRPNTATRLRMFVQYLKARWASWRTGRRIAAQPAP